MESCVNHRFFSLSSLLERVTLTYTVVYTNYDIWNRSTLCLTELGGFEEVVCFLVQDRSPSRRFVWLFLMLCGETVFVVSNTLSLYVVRRWSRACVCLC